MSALKIRFFIYITFSLDRLSNNQSLKFVFDSNRKICDILLYNESSENSINRKYFRITINTDTRVLIVNNESIYSTVVTFRRFEKLILRKTSISIFVYNNIQIDLVIFCLLILFRESCQNDFEQNWKSYCSERNATRVKSFKQLVYQY